MSKQARINRLLDILKQKNGVSIRDLSGMLGVTEMTIRRDVRQLQESRIVKLVSGAVLYDQGTTADPQGEYSLAVHAGRRMSEKYYIGQLAASLVQPKDIIFVDIGTTAVGLIQHLPENIPVSCVCCSLNALKELERKGIDDIILLGGRYRPELQMFDSKEGVDLLKRTRITKAFVSAAGVSEKLGITCINSCEVETKSAAMESSLEKILMVDSGKFDQIKPAYFSSLHHFDAVVTDHKISDEWVGILQELGIEVHIANLPQ